MSNCQARKGSSSRATPRAAKALLALLSTSPSAMAQCISLRNSTTCPAFQSASVSKDSYLTGLYPFLSFVSDTKSFDKQLSDYVRTTYIQSKYQQLLGCDNVNLTNTSELYARFTTTVICNALIQNSIDSCHLSADVSRPVCAESCAQFAESEAYIIADGATCSNPSGQATDQIRADFTNCALPANSLSSSQCISAINNEPENCGYGQSTIGLCSYCASGGINSTDTCCYNSDVKNRCAGIQLPSITPTVAFNTPVPTGSQDDNGSGGLSGGAIAGIVVGSVLGLALIAAAIAFCAWRRRRRQASHQESILNLPSPTHRPGSMAQAQASAPRGYDAVPGGGRVARMSALEGPLEAPRADNRHNLGAAASGVAPSSYGGASRRRTESNSMDGYGRSFSSERPVPSVSRAPPRTARRNESMSSGSILAGDYPQSVVSGPAMSSPQGMASQQSEQLPFFKDYYSQDDIHPGDRVAVLWAYRPRAADEFTLERGDMLKVVGIWDDGWATGIMTDERATDWEARRQHERDSGVSHTSGRGNDNSPPISGEIKAFPLVCVCLPEHWRKTIDNDGSTDTMSSPPQPSGS